MRRFFKPSKLGQITAEVSTHMRFSTILGIESSCDDTAAAVWQNGKILANITAGQPVHEAYGGVVPELASRAHQSNIVPVVQQALKKSNVDASQLDAIAFTLGPGLMGSLLVGANFAKGMAMASGKKLIGINHLQAHIAALFIENPQPAFPILCLLVSGGHTQLLLVRDFMNMEIVGKTLDDAAGEAFDKAAKLLGLPYPGGPWIDRLAKEGDPTRFPFPESKVPGLNMSFSGIKTSLLYFLRDQTKKNAQFVEENVKDICASYQHHVVHYLLSKTQSAIETYAPAAVALAGGVSANSLLRNSLMEMAKKNSLPAYIPSFEYCTDNAAMIATAAHYLLEKGEETGLDALPFVRGI